MDEQRNVLASLAKRWNHDPNHIEAIEEIRPKAPLIDHRREIPMRCGNHPDVDGYKTRCTDGPNLFVLQGAQEFRLDVGRDLANLIEEEGSSICDSKQAPARQLPP